MIVIIDYDCGNLFSLASSFKKIGAESMVSSDPDVIANADSLVLPGVGAFSDAALKLKKTGIGEAVKSAAASGTPLLGICLGMQLLFDRSFEYGEWEGLGLIPGEVVPMKGIIDPSLKIPQIGWNALDFKKETPIFSRINNGDHVYFVHSYYASGCDDYIMATTDYSIPVTASVQNGSVFGCQFHPEKSGDTGLEILRAFCSVGGNKQL